MDPEVLTVIDIIRWAARIEEYHLPMDFSDRKKLVEATYEYVDKIRPLYLKYNDDGR